MAHFAFILNDDGSIAHILRDGALHQETVVLEQVHSVVTTYFKAANQNIVAMENVTDREQLRFRGLQAFLMCLTGVEAFTNVFFHILGEERQLAELLRRAGRRQGPLIQRLTDCLSLAFHGPLEGQGQLMSRIGELYQLRNQIVHSAEQGAPTLHITRITGENAVLQMLNSKLPSSDFRHCARLIKAFVGRTPLQPLLDVASLRKIVATAEGSEVQIESEHPLWLAMAHLFPEILDGMVRAELQDLKRLPKWAKVGLQRQPGTGADCLAALL